LLTIISFQFTLSAPSSDANPLVAICTPSHIRVPPHRKDQKKVDKLEAQIPYHEGRGNKEEVEKIKEQVAAIWAKTREAAMA
jgi:hypothetical protein